MLSQEELNILKPHFAPGQDVDLDENTNRKTKMLWTHGCEYNHVFLKSVSSMLRKQTCVFCHGTEVLAGLNDFATCFPHLLSSWDYSKNSIDPSSVRPTSRVVVWWLCSQGHSYDMPLVSRTSGEQGCPYCSGKRVLQGFNDVATTHPEVVKYWDWDKNTITPYDLTSGSGKKIWMKCDANHSWETAMCNYSIGGYRCPYCFHKVLPGETDLATTYPHLVDNYWDFDKNDVSPSELSAGSEVRAWWLCSKGHSFQAAVYSRKNKPDKDVCPVCDGKQVLFGYNDLFTVRPDVASEWDFDKNDMSPKDVYFGTKKKFHFICPEGHNYKTSLCYRTLNNTRCPVCAKRRSKLEMEICDFIKEIAPNDMTIMTNHRDIPDVKEVDIYIPEKNIAIEVNDAYWHSSSRKRFSKWTHYEKWKACKNSGIQLLTVWEDDWRTKKHIVQSMLRHKIGMSKEVKIFARETVPVQISHKDSAQFLYQHHLQGATKGSCQIGLMDKNNNIVAVSSWRKQNDVLYLDRYATSCQVVGGMGKLLKAGKQFAQQNDCKSIVTFSDNEVSDGGLYSSLGFKKDKELEPDYKYIYNNIRHHKFNFRKKRFQNDRNLLYDSTMTESQLAELNNIPKVYDCGKIRWICTL